MTTLLHTTRRTHACALALATVVTSVLMLASPATSHAEALFAISGRGWGHGIGMTQYGAKGYAEQGRTYDWILAHYFQGTTLADRVELTVKVDLDADKAARSSWRITAARSTDILTVTDYTNGASGVQVPQGSNAWITFTAGGAVLRTDTYDSATKTYVPGSIVATFPGSVVAATGAMADSEVRVLSASGPYDNLGIGWRGEIRFVPNTTTGHAIDYVPMEQYLRGVVPRESPSSWHIEALRAQAVAARSYAYEAASAGSTLWCTTMSQMYNGADHTSGGAHSHESSRTDAAIAYTTNQFVVYGNSVIKTFFSSASGGRTANSKDVWFSSHSDDESPVYYTSVEDADDASPNYRWTLADMTGTAMAGLLRTHYASRVPASPATVETVTLEPGASGYIRYISVHWTTGANTELTGPEFQHALSLKSSAFSVRLKNPPLPAMTRYQETDARPLWTGTWALAKTASASGGSYRTASKAGVSVTVMFKGASVSWIGFKNAYGGKADVSLDGAHQATVDLYDSSSHYKTTVWSRSGLAVDATHTLTIQVLGTKRAASKGTAVRVDAFDTSGTMLAVPRPPVWKRYEETSNAIAFKGAWTKTTLAGMSGGAHAFSHTASATATFTFNGTQVRWIGKRAANYGKAWVSVDASAPVLVDLYAGSVANQQKLFQSPVLAAGTHTVTVRVAGTKNAKSSYDYVDVDAFEALEPAR